MHAQHNAEPGMSSEASLTTPLFRLVFVVHAASAKKQGTQPCDIEETKYRIARDMFSAIIAREIITCGVQSMNRIEV